MNPGHLRVDRDGGTPRTTGKLDQHSFRCIGLHLPTSRHRELHLNPLPRAPVLISPRPRAGAGHRRPRRSPRLPSTPAPAAAHARVPSYRFGFGAIATSNTRSPSASFATPCGSPGSDQATPPGPRLHTPLPDRKPPLPLDHVVELRGARVGVDGLGLPGQEAVDVAEHLAGLEEVQLLYPFGRRKRRRRLASMIPMVGTAQGLEGA